MAHRNPMILAPPAHEGAAIAPNQARIGGRPHLREDKIVDYLDWLAGAIAAGTMLPAQSGALLRCAELAISIQHADAQAKATQHTLVEDGTIDPPPKAS